MAYRRTPADDARRAATRAQLLAAAHALVAERGYAGCAVGEVAARAGLSTGALYRHWPGKADLLVEVFRVACSREVAAFTAAALDARGGCVCTRVTAAVATFAARALAAPRLAHALLVEPVDPAVDAERLAFRATYRDLLAATLAEGVAAGDVPEQDVTVTAAALVGAIGEALVVPLVTPRVSPRATVGAPPATVPALTELVVRAIGGHHADHPRGHQPATAPARARRG